MKSIPTQREMRIVIVESAGRGIPQPKFFSSVDLSFCFS